MSDVRRDPRDIVRRGRDELDSLVDRGDRGRTHWDGCHSFNGHHACALAKIEELQREMNALRVRTGTTEDWVLP